MTEETVTTLIRQVSPGSPRLSSKANLMDDLGFDSIKMLELIVEIENKFNIQISEQDLNINYFSTVDSICELLKKY
ncbi:MAG: phosphopantetheine-binding protein [Ginsengibacter sp.]